MIFSVIQLNWNILTTQTFDLVVSIFDPTFFAQNTVLQELLNETNN